jgi:Pyruvate/2-oxoacid:ferredoxin oxidoreductase delta subunit
VSDDHAMTDGSDTPSVSGAERELGSVIDAPDFILPWLGRFYDEDAAALVLAAAAGQVAGADPARLERAYRRAVLDRDESGSYAPADLHHRLELWAMFEGWKDVPLAVHRQLADWDVAHYAAKAGPEVESIRAGHPNDSYEARYGYVLLHEAETILAAQERIYLWPCDCRAIVGNCRKARDVCLRFSNDRGLGWEISRERATEILRAADKAGLMHTSDYDGDAAASTSICNCCTDCCYPHLAAERLGTDDVWPVRRYVARIDMEACKSCGRCGLRCPFEAIICGSGGRPELDASLCRGCGLCETGCSSDAIELLPITG